MHGVVPLAIMTGMHIWACLAFCTQRNWPMAVVFGAYALATLGFIWGLK